MAYFQLRYFFILFLLFCSVQTSLHAQQTLGVTWDIPTNPDSAQQQLERFNELGISALEITELPSEDVWKHIDSLGFAVYANLDIQFPTTSTFSDPDSTFIENIQQKSEASLSHPSVKAVGLFNNGNIYKTSFWKAISPFAEELKQVKDIDLYHKSNTAASTDTTVVSSALITVPVTPSNFESLSLPTANVLGYQYAPSSEIKDRLTPFKHFVESVNLTQNTLIFFDSDWVHLITEKHPQTSEILLSITSESDPVFPLPEETLPTPESTSFPIIALLIIWGTVALHYNMSPLYRKSLFRYFFAHKFFIDDIFKRVIRSSMPAIIILVQNALLLGLAVYSTFSALITSLGQEAFFYHFPHLSLVGSNPLSIFLWTFILILLISFVGIIWLYFTHNKLNSITQIAIVYAWPLQLNFLFCTVAVTFVSPSNPFTAIIFTILATLLFLLSFIFTAMDISRFSKSKVKYHLKTTFPYLLIITGVLGWAISKDEWIEVLNFAINLT